MIKKILLLLILASIGCSFWQKQEVLAQIGDQILHLSDFEEKLTPHLANFDPAYQTNPEFMAAVKASLLDDMIMEEILYLEGTQLGITIDKEEMAKRLSIFKSGYSEETFREVLKIKGVDQEIWKSDRLKHMIGQKLVEKTVISKMTFTDSEIKTYYNTHPDLFKLPEQVRARQILVTEKSLAKKIYDQLTKGENFANLARQHSISPEGKNGGDLGFFAKGSYPEIFDKYCFNLQVGAFSQPIESEFGFHIFKVLDRKKQRVIPVSEAEEEIRDLLIKEKGEDLINAAKKSLRLKYPVTINKRVLKDAQPKKKPL